MSVPVQGMAAGSALNSGGSKSAPRRAAVGETPQREQATKYPSRRPPGTSANQANPQTGSAAFNSAPAQSAAQPGKYKRELADSQATQALPKGFPEIGSTQSAAVGAGTNLNLSDSPIPNPLRSSGSNGPQSAVAKPSNRTGRTKLQSAVQTVGYQEEIPIVSGEQIPKNPENVTRLAMLEEPALAEPTPASVLEAGEAEPMADPTIAESAPAEMGEAEQQLPLDESEPQQEVPIVQAPASPGLGNSMNLYTPAANAQGHYQQGTAVFGQVLNEPQQTASQRAIQLLDENQRLREEMKAKLKELENAQAKLKQQDELWARARQEFLEVRGVVDNLTRENSLLKMQIEKLEGEKVELARQYQSLMQTVEQTLDDLLLKAITQPPEGNPPATTPATVPVLPPAAAPSAQPPPAPPIVSGQQASALLKSPQ